MAWATVAVTLVAIIKEAVVAKSFGAGRELDAFLLSFSIAFFFPTLLSTTLQGTFVPSFTTLFKSDPGRAWRFASATLNLLALSMAACLIIFLAASSFLISALAPGFGEASRRLSVSLLWTLAPTVVLFGINEQMKNTLYAVKVFALPSLSQALPSLCAIVTIVLMARRWGVYAFAHGWNVGLAAQSMMLFWSLKRQNASYWPIIDFSIPELRRLTSLSLSYIFVPLSLLGLQLVDKYFASVLGAGVISYFNYADKLFRVPWIIIATALFTTALPFFSEQATDHSFEELKDSISLTLRLTAFLTLPIVVGISVLSRPLVSILFERGAFTAADTAATAYVVIGFMASLFFYATTFIFDRGLCALGQTRILMKLAIMTLLLKILFAWMMARNWGLFGLALSTVPALAFQSCAMYAAIRVRIGTLRLQSLFISLCKTIIACTVMGTVVFAVENSSFFWLSSYSNYHGGISIGFSIILGGSIYWLASLGMRSREAKDLVQILGGREELKELVT